jgi:hypothetical protein
MEEVYFVGANGATLELTDYATYLLQSRNGWTVPKVEVFTEPLPNVPGSRFNGRVTRERTVSFSLAVVGLGWEDAQDKVAAAATLLAQDGYLKVIRGAVERRLDVRYAGGLEGDTGARRGPSVQTLVPEYRATQPYWYDPTEQTALVDTAASQLGVQLPMALPVLFLSPGENAVGSLQAGDVASPWTFEALGPFTRVQLVKLATGERLDLTKVIPYGSTLRLSTHPGTHQVTLDTGFGAEPLRGGLSLDSTYWQLDPGLNQVAVIFTGATNKSGLFRWHKRYLAWGAA